MNKKTVAISLVFAILVSLCGCQLAQPESGNHTEADRLVGVFITTEYLDLNDADAYRDEYLKNNAGSISDGDTIILDSKEHLGRVYATFVEEPYQDADGEYHFSNNYEFSGLEGISLATYQIQSGEESYYTSSVGEGICDVHMKSGGENQGISGTIWMAKNSGEVIYYMNPIYQTADGRVYLVPGSGLHISSDVGGRASQKIEEKVTATENGEAYSYTFSAEVFIDFADPAETVTILQMNKQDEEVKRETFLADNLPKQFVPGDNTAYLIVISESSNGVHRQINQPNEDKIEVFVQFGEQICIKDYIFVEWE